MNSLTHSQTPSDPTSVQQFTSVRDHYRFRDEVLCKFFLVELNQMREQGTYCDVTLECDEVSMRCHRVVLSAASPYFRAMFNSGLAEALTGRVRLQGVKNDTLEILLTYMYTWQADITTESVQSLVQACELLQLPGLKGACQTFMLRHLYSDNSVGLYRFASLYDLSSLKQGARHTMLTHFLEVVQGPEFPRLTAKELLDYVSDDRLQVANEDVVFDAVTRWVACDPSNRRQQVSQVLLKVRFPFCSSAYLCHVASKHELMASQEGSVLLEEARLFQILPEQRSSLAGLRINPRLSFNWPERLLALGGSSHEAKENRCCWFLQERTSTWELLAQLPRPSWRHHHACVVANGIVLSGGWQNGAKAECWLFDTVEKRWLVVGTLATPRYNHSSVALGEHVYVVGGQDNQQRPLASVEVMVVISRSWQPCAELPVALSCPLVTTCGHLLVVTGGRKSDGEANTNTFTYDSVWGIWKRKADMPCACPDASTAAVAGRMYVVGGMQPVCLQYEPVADRWVELEPPRHPHSMGAVVAWRGTLLLAGGATEDGQPTALIEQLQLVQEHSGEQRGHQEINQSDIVEKKQAISCCLQMSIEMNRDQETAENVSGENENSSHRKQREVCECDAGDDETQKGDGEKTHSNGERRLEVQDTQKADTHQEQLEEMKEVKKQKEHDNESHHDELPASSNTQAESQSPLERAMSDHIVLEDTGICTGQQRYVPATAGSPDLCSLQSSSIANEEVNCTNHGGINVTNVVPSVRWSVMPTALRQPLQGHILLVVDVCGL